MHWSYIFLELDCWYTHSRCSIEVNKYILWKNDNNEAEEMTSETWWDASQGNELYIKDTYVQVLIDNKKYHAKDGNPRRA